MRHGRTVGFELKALNNQIKRTMDNNAVHSHAAQMTGMHHGMIFYISGESKKRDVFQKDIEAEFNIRRSTATGILQLMEKNGLLIREPVARDARLKKLVLTPKALELKEQIIREVEEMEQKMTRGIPPEDLDVFFRVIQTIRENLEA